MMATFSGSASNSLAILRSSPSTTSLVFAQRQSTCFNTPIAFGFATLPLEFDELQRAGEAFAGTADGARAYIKQQTEASGTNYFVCDIALGTSRARRRCALPNSWLAK